MWRDHRFRNWKPAADRETVHDNPGKGTGKGSTTDGSDDDFQYGAGNVSIQLGLKGKCTNVVTACATGTNCIGDALRAIQYGDADVMFAGGTESCICPTGIAGFTALTALTTREDPLRASIPFDKDRSGFVLGEGAGVVVLEELEHARARGAKIYAELAGYGATGDAYHITSPAEDGSGAAKAMELAMEEGARDTGRSTVH